MQDTTEVIDVGLMSHWKRTRAFVEKENGIVEEQFRYDPLPEEWMAKLEEFLGDGNANVTVSQDVGTSEDFGNKAGAFVSVKVTCGNTEDEIRGAHNIARDLVQELVQEDYVESKKMLDAIRFGKPQDKKEQVTTGRKLTGRPNFRR